MERAKIDAGIAAVQGIVARHGLAFDEVEIVRCSNNLVLRLHPLPLIAKVATGERLCGKLELAVATHLRSAGVPCVSPSTALPVQAYTTDGLEVTFWEYFEGAAIETPDRGESLNLVRQLHAALAAFDYVGLPRFEAVRDCIASLDQESVTMPGLAEVDRNFLSRILKKLMARLDEMKMEWGVIHGDCRPHNLLWNEQGAAKWLDFEAVCLGPVAWDYLSFFGAEDEVLKPYAGSIDVLSDVTHACVATWCWRKSERLPKEQEAAEYHLEQLKRKYS